MVLHPDLLIRSDHVYVAITTVILLLYAFVSLAKNKKYKIIYYFESTVIASGLLIFIVNALNIKGFIYGFMSVLFALFIGPIYGFNSFIEVNYATYSLFVSIYFLVVMIMTMTFDKERKNRLR